LSHYLARHDYDFLHHPLLRHVGMEAENPPMTSSKPPPLNSDQLNYLIWRLVALFLGPRLSERVLMMRVQISSRSWYVLFFWV